MSCRKGVDHDANKRDRAYDVHPEHHMVHTFRPDVEDRSHEHVEDDPANELLGIHVR